MILSLLEPTVVPGLDRALLEILIIFATVIGAVLFLSVGSIVGIVRAMRRRRRGEHSVAAVVCALVAVIMAAIWLCYWTGDNLSQRHNPIDGLLAINLSICVLPLWWLIAAIRAQTSSLP